MSLSGGLLAEARALVERREAATAGLWPRAAAALTRQALELALRDLWRARAPGVEPLSLRAQLLCLGEYARSERAAATAQHAWVALSRACHHHPYEVEPSADELRYWIDAVEECVVAIQARSRSSRATTDPAATDPTGA